MSKNRNPYEQEAIDKLNELGESLEPSFSKGDGSIPPLNTKHKENQQQRQIDFGHIDYSEAFYDGHPSEELTRKEKQRLENEREERMQADKELTVLEDALCAKYGISHPHTLINTMKNGNSTKDTQLLCIGDTINDRRNPQTWGITQEARTRHMQILGPSGSGKATPLYVNVLTEKGWIKNGDLSIGDRIYTRNGTLANIIGISKTKYEQIWEIEFEDGQIVECSADHLWIIERKNHNSHKEYVYDTKHLYEQGIKNPGKSAGYRNRVPLTKPIQWEEKNFFLDPYALGLLLGDGCTCKKDNAIYFSSADKELVNRLQESLGPDYIVVKGNDDPQDYTWYIKKYYEEEGKFLPPIELKAWLREQGLDVKAHQKFIPEDYKHGSIEQRKELIRGLMDTDGTAHKGRFSFSTSSIRLRDDVRYILASLGIETHVHEDYRPEKYVYVDSCWEVSILSNDPDSLFALTRKKEEFYKYCTNRKQSFNVYSRGDIQHYDNETNISSLPIPPYTFGLLLRSQLRETSISVSASVFKTFPDILERVKKELGQELIITENTGKAHCDFYDFFISGGKHKNGKRINALLENVRKLKCDVPLRSRFIPEIYLHASPDARQDLLQGILDASGNIHGRNIEFCSKSSEFLLNMEELVTSLGYSYDRYEYKYTKGLKIHLIDKNMFWASANREEVQRQIDTDAISKTGCSRQNRHTSTAIVDIRPTDRYTNMRCIRVDDPTESYIIEGFKVTHNSTLLHQLLVQDLWYNRGGLLLEPHGDLAESCLYTAPPYRIHDVIYLDVTDLDYSPGLNPLYIPPGAGDYERNEAIGEVVDLISRHFNMDEKMARLRKNLMNALVALSYTPGATLLEVMDFYMNPDVQATVLSFMPEGNMKENCQQAAANAKTDELSSLENRISQFTTNRFMKHLFGQSHSTIDFYKEMNRGSMIICPVSKGGSSDSSFLKFYGSYIVSTIYKEAMRRTNINADDRIIFPLTIDEFQNFMTGDIENMLAELRKYGLPLCLAHQYLNQLDKGIRSSINNSCSTKLIYRLGSEDAAEISKWLSSDIRKITASELATIEKYHVMAAPFINGQTQPPFITKLFPPLKNKTGAADITAQLIREHTRERYMKRRDDIDKEIDERKERLASGNKEAVIEMATKKNK